MQFQLKLQRIGSEKALPINYQYPLSAAIYKIIARADEVYAKFLHDAGYGLGMKKFKFFTFSDLQTPFHIQGDRLVMNSDEAKLQICFFLPEAAETFVRGLFTNGQVEIADNRSRVAFTIQQVESVSVSLPPPAADGRISVVLEPLGPLVSGRKNDRGHYDYLAPDDDDFVLQLCYNLAEKWASLKERTGLEKQDLLQQLEMVVMPNRKPVQQRLVTIKANTPEETKVKGFKNFRLQMHAPPELVDIALGAGLGAYCAMGFGAVGIAKSMHHGHG